MFLSLIVFRLYHRVFFKPYIIHGESSFAPPCQLTGYCKYLLYRDWFLSIWAAPQLSVFSWVLSVCCLCVLPALQPLWRTGCMLLLLAGKINSSLGPGWKWILTRQNMGSRIPCTPNKNPLATAAWAPSQWDHSMLNSMCCTRQNRGKQRQTALLPAQRSANSSLGGEVCYVHRNTHVYKYTRTCTHLEMHTAQHTRSAGDRQLLRRNQGNFTIGKTSWIKSNLELRSGAKEGRAIGRVKPERPKAGL